MDASEREDASAKNLRGASVAALAVCGIWVQAARADVVVQYDVSGTISTSGGNITFPQFNPSLGQLQFGDLAVDSLGEVTGIATFDIPGCPACPGGGLMALLTGYVSDGVPVGFPPPPQFILNVSATGGSTEEIITVPWGIYLPTGVFGDFTYDPTFVGTGTSSVYFPITVSETLPPTGVLPPFLTNFTVIPSISYTAHVSYDYVPVPEPRLILPAALLLLGTVTLRFRGQATKTQSS